ncbi:MAG TPA: glycosyltransferase 87 family protein [Solirubrobacteraceae bacterium]|nr:glycosyltransferase 87 family protein [Solirubrobacteraceae bacterium]
MGTKAAWACCAAGALALSLILYFHFSHGLNQPFHVGARKLRFFDLRVYRGAAQRILSGTPIYGRPLQLRLGFTYPPAAALVMVPLTLVSLHRDELIVTLVNVGALVWMLRRALLLPRPSQRFAPAALRTPVVAWSVAMIAAAGMLWLEPVTVGIGYGQIDLVIALLVVLDLSLDDGARGKGLTIGLAAGLKLTPLMFIPYLLFSGRRRAALLAALAFTASVGLSFVVAPADASRYWGGLFLKTSRVGGAADTSNQSLRGALARLLHIWHPGMGVALVVIAVGIIGLWLAVRASQSGNEAAGYGLCAVTTLLVSPVSWTHHWVLAVPGLLLLAVVGYEQGSVTLLAGAAMLLLVGYSYLPELTMTMHHSPMADRSILQADPYVLAGLAVLSVAGLRAYRISVAPLRRSQPAWSR